MLWRKKFAFYLNWGYEPIVVSRLRYEDNCVAGLCWKSGKRCLFNMEPTWRVSEGQSVDYSFSLYGKEKSTPIWTPTAGLNQKKDAALP